MKKKIIIFIIIGIFVGFLLKDCKPTLSNELKHKFDNQNMNDSIMYDSRHNGYISLDKFIALALKADKSVFDTTCIKRDGDSISFIVKQPKMFYGSAEKTGYYWWREKYKKLRIRIFDDNSFKAEIKVKDDKEYIYIPYHILSCLVDFIGESNSSKSTQKTVQKDENGQDITTIRSEKDLQNVAETGNKIQIEGIVFKNVSDIITMSGYQSGDKYEQIEILWKYVRAHWTYIHDPAQSPDTWRSASETIENYYFTSEKRYSGDCDDFAILMASFARQIGLRSRFVCAVGKDGGHAYAEFFVPNEEIKEMRNILDNVYSINGNGGIWVNMDWFSDHLGGKPFDGKRVKIMEDL